MKITAPKNKKLIAQFPFLIKILNEEMEPYGEPLLNGFDEFSVKVQYADGDLMYRVADNIGLGENSYCYSEKKEGQIMKKGEYLFAIDDQGNILRRVSWPRNREERSMVGAVYGRNSMRKIPDNRELEEYIGDKVKHLVWVTIGAWHIDTHKDTFPGERFGRFVSRDIQIVIYQEPKCGFDKLYEDSNVFDNLRLNREVLDRGFFRKNSDILQIMGNLDELCRLFQDDVFDNGLKDMIERKCAGGISAMLGSVKVSAALDRIEIQDSVSLLLIGVYPDSGRLRFVVQDGTLPQLRNLVKTVVRYWNSGLEGRSNFKSI